MSWQADFTEHTTGSAFNLSLSKYMVWALSAIDRDEFKGLIYYPMAITTIKGLRERGLVERIGEVSINGPLTWVLTPAGKLTLEMLKLAGLVANKAAEENAA